MMEICGYNARYHHLIQMGSDYPWFSQYTCSSAEADEFREWFMQETIKSFKKRHRVLVARELASKRWAGFWLMWGLRTV